MPRRSRACCLKSRCRAISNCAVDAGDVPANRAALKLLTLLEGLSSEESQATRIAEIADLIKSEYFRLSDAELRVLSSRFDEQHLELLRADVQTLTPETVDRLKNRYRIGFWDADALENAFAYVGSDLTVSAWLARAHKLFTDLPGATATKEILEHRSRRAGSRHGHRRQRRERRNRETRRERRREEAASVARHSSRGTGMDRARGPAICRTASRRAARRQTHGVARRVDAAAGSFRFSRSDCRAGAESRQTKSNCRK